MTKWWAESELFLSDPKALFIVWFFVQLDLETIKDMYLEKFDVTLKDALSSDCGGDFKRLLLAVLH